MIKAVRTQAGFAEALKQACDNIGREAADIIGDISNTKEITVLIRITHDGVAVYEINKIKYVHYDEAVTE